MEDIKNYKSIDLQVENENLKDEIIQLLKNEVKRLELELSKHLGFVQASTDEPEKDQGSHMIAPAPRPVLRTMSEVQTLLEHKSIIGARKEKELDNV